MDIRAQKIERIQRGYALPSGAINKAVRSRIIRARNPLPIIQKSSNIMRRNVADNMSHNIALMRDEITRLSLALRDSTNRIRLVEDDGKKRIADLIRFASIVDADIQEKKKQAGRIDARMANVIDMISSAEDRLHDALMDMRLAVVDREKLERQIDKMKLEINDLLLKKTALESAGNDARLNVNDLHDSISALNEKIIERSNELASLDGEMQRYNQRVKDLGIYERRIRRYCKEAGINISI